MTSTLVPLAGERLQIARPGRQVITGVLVAVLTAFAAVVAGHSPRPVARRPGRA